MSQFEKEKHVEMLRVAGEALSNVTILQWAAQMAAEMRLTPSHDYDGLVFYRPKTDEELAAAEAARVRGAEAAAEYDRQREERDRARAEEWGWSYEDYLARQKQVRGY